MDIVFDLDGTLIDSIPDVASALNRLLAQEGRRALALDEARVMVGEGAEAMIRRGFAATGAAPEAFALEDLVERYLAFYRRHPADQTLIYPGVRDTLERFRAQGLRLGICTNKPHEMSVLVLRELGLATFFGAVLGAGVMPAGKPDPAHIEAVLAAMGAAKEDAIYVGDSETDVITARRAGIPVVVVGYGYSRVPVDMLGADAVIERFADLPDALAQLRTPAAYRA